MPKKKTKSGAKSDDDKKMKTKRDLDSATKVVSELEEKEKIVYLAQIRLLNEKLERYEQKCDELEKQKKDLNFKSSALEKEKADIVEFLSHSLLAKEEEVERLSERLDHVQQTAQREQEEMQRQHSVDMEQLQNKAGTLTVENKALVEKLTLVEKFLKERSELTANLEALKKQLSQQENEHRLTLHNLDIQALMEKKRWEKKLEGHASSMEAEVQHLVNQRLPETTSVALQENQQLKEHFSLLSEHAQGLVLKNAALHNKKTAAELDVENLEQMLKEVSRKNCVQKKVLEQLTDRCALLQTELHQCRQKHQQLHSLHSHSLDEMETLRQDKASVFKECNQNQQDISRLEAELQQERRKRSEMKGVLQKGCIILKQALVEADVEESKEHVDKWKLLMQKLLVILAHSEYAKVEVKEVSRRLVKKRE